MAAHRVTSRNYTWRNCEDFKVPDNSVWYGRDDDGSDIFCGKAWCDGEEVPAQVIPNRRECRVIDNGCEKVVPNCRKVLVCSGSEGNSCHRRRDHCHRHTHHRCNNDSSSSGCEEIVPNCRKALICDGSARDNCQRRRDHCHQGKQDRCDCDSSSSDSEEESRTTKKESKTCNNESKVSEKRIKSCSSSTSTTVKKSSKKHHKKRESRGEQCRYERRTRMVPKVTVRPRIRYVPKVTNERTVRYVQQSYVTRVCGRRRCEPCEPCEPCPPCNRYEPCEPCEPCDPCDPCEPCEPCDPCDPCKPCDPCRKNRTILYSAPSGNERSIQGRKCINKSSSRRMKWF